MGASIYADRTKQERKVVFPELGLYFTWNILSAPTSFFTHCDILSYNTWKWLKRTGDESHSYVSSWFPTAK